MHGFGEILRERRLAAGFGLRRFAERVGIKPSNLSQIENGRRSAPGDPEMLATIADCLGLAEGSKDREELFDAARRPGALPADVGHMAGRRMVPVLLRTIDNRQLSDADIERLVADIERRSTEVSNVV